MRTYVYHDSPELIIVDKIVRDSKNHRGIQGQLLHALNASVKRVYDAHEIWWYNEEFHVFEAYKNVNDKHTLLGVFFEEQQINVKYDSKMIQSFHTPKDLFLFKLKFL